MFQYRFCTEEDFPVWLELNRAFMEEEIQDNSLWNCVDQDETEKFYRTFCKARKENDFIRLFLFEVDGQTIGFANVLIIFSVWAVSYTHLCYGIISAFRIRRALERQNILWMR